VLGKRPAPDDNNPGLHKKKVLSFFEEPSLSVLESRGDGRCFYRCILHVMHEHFGWSNLDFLQSEEPDVLRIIDRFRAGYAKTLAFISQDDKSDMWIKIQDTLSTNDPPTDVVEWQQRMNTPASALVGRARWADDLAVALTPIVFALMDSHIKLHIYPLNGQGSSKTITSGVDVDAATVIELYYDGQHYDIAMSV
jgi:hypothetical protein